MSSSSRVEFKTFKKFFHSFYELLHLLIQPPTPHFRLPEIQTRIQKTNTHPYSLNILQQMQPIGERSSSSTFYSFERGMGNHQDPKMEHHQVRVPFTQMQQFSKSFFETFKWTEKVNQKRCKIQHQIQFICPRPFLENNFRLLTCLD